MDPFRNPPADTLAAARLHVQALTDCGLPREALLRALLENYGDGGATSRADTGFPQQPPQQGQQTTQVQGKMSQNSFNTRLSVSTTSSNSSGRASVLSTATTMSSVSSQAAGQEIAPPLPPPPAPLVKSSNRGTSKPQGAYWCTFCDVAFQRKFDWKRHEDEFHERYKRYPCPNCNSIFWGANTFNQHHKNAHGCTTCPHADRVVRYTQRKQAWACGFCGGFLASRDRYFDHVARHYEDGCNKSHWNHSLVIYGLLHQPSISHAWKELDATLYGHLPRNQQPMLEWDPKVTGHAQGFLEGESPGKLQDLLEFFNERRDDPQLLARLAHDSAIIRFRHELQPVAGQAPASRPISEPPKPKPVVKATPLIKHMSTPKPVTPQPPPPYDGHPLAKKQRSIAPTPSTFAKPIPTFEQQRPQPQPSPQRQPHGLISPFSQTTATSTTGGFYDLAVTHVHPHMQHNHQQQQQQQQQQPPDQSMIVPMAIFEDWSSLAGTVVDESVFASALAHAHSQGWQTDMRGGHRHPGSEG
ncbi:PR domain zinc finger protein 14 [Madurella mycetomatis]|uniref:PR domain zinc finger protein 14 n=1 Tax=Madurella mycetomatis TaxID=100816 RepID=A0A175VNN8_9PEZI|nr:PR domain zinc finger protein 14 [Madurella mycetomatis]